MSILKAKSDLTLWVDVPGFLDFEIKVKYLTPANIKVIRDKATKTQLNKQTRQMEEVVDDDLMARYMVREMIQDWRGLTVKTLQTMMPLSEESATAINEEYDGELPFTNEDLETLVDFTYSRSFMDRVTELSTDMEEWRRVEEESTGKD
jgi:hypothetical protein